MTWFLLQTKPKSEDLAATNVRAQGHHAFLPRFYDMVKHRVDIMFPSYLFVSSRGQWSHFLSTRGVSGIVKMGDTPSPVPFAEIKRLRALRDKKGIIRLPERRRFHFNQRVRIEGGAFFDHVGWYQGASTEQRVMVLLDLLGRKTPVSLHEAQLSAA